MQDEALGSVLVFARAPELGRVKTRLAARLGDEATLALYRAFLDDTLAAARASGARILLAHTRGTFDAQAAADACIEQRGDGFAARLDHAIGEARRAAPRGPLLVLGADTPHLAPAATRAHLDRLRAHDGPPSIVGPSRAGGFHCVGFASRTVPLARAFTRPNEAARLVELLRGADLAPALVEPCFDVDVPGDLADLVALLELLRAADAPWIPAATERAIRELGIEVDDRDERAVRLAVGERDS